MYQVISAGKLGPGARYHEGSILLLRFPIELMALLPLAPPLDTCQIWRAFPARYRSTMPVGPIRDATTDPDRPGTLRLWASDVLSMQATVDRRRRRGPDVSNSTPQVTWCKVEGGTGEVAGDSGKPPSEVSCAARPPVCLLGFSLCAGRDLGSWSVSGPSSPHDPLPGCKMASLTL